MKNILILFTLLFLGQIQAQQPQINQNNVQDIVRAYIDYFDEYDPLAPEAVRKAKFNKVVNKENPNLSKANREKAFKIVDAYIRADKGLDPGIRISDQDKQMIQNMLNDARQQKDKGMQAMIGEVNRIQNMSYSEYKNFVTQNGQVPLKEIDIKKAYNQMHKNDGKAVAITEQDKQKAKQLTIVEAVDIIQNPDKHSYNEFKAAMKLIQPNVSDKDIQKTWKKVHQ